MKVKYNCFDLESTPIFESFKLIQLVRKHKNLLARWLAIQKKSHLTNQRKHQEYQHTRKRDA